MSRVTQLIGSSDGIAKSLSLTPVSIPHSAPLAWKHIAKDTVVLSPFSYRCIFIFLISELDFVYKFIFLPIFKWSSGINQNRNKLSCLLSNTVIFFFWITFVSLVQKEQSTGFLVQINRWSVSNISKCQLEGCSLSSPPTWDILSG